AGLAYGYAAVMRDLARPGVRQRLPDEALLRFGATREDVAAGHTTFELRAALAEMRLRARRFLSEAAELVLQMPDAALPALLPAAVIRPTLALMERPGYQ